MGGRGASSGMSDSKKPYGTEYKTIFEDGNVKFVTRNEGAANVPIETMTRGRVYVSVNSQNKLKSISYYDSSGKRTKQIDLDHNHKGMDIHTHHGYNHNENDGPKGAAKLTPEEKKIVDRVKELWYNHNNSKR